MTYKDRSRAVYSTLLFLMMISFTVSSYAVPCHDLAENKIGVSLKQYHSTLTINFYLSNQPSVVQDYTSCQNHTNTCVKCYCRCKVDNQPSALIGVENKKSPNYHNHKNINDSLQVLPTKSFVIYKSTYKFNHSYSSSLSSPLQSTQKYRILLI